MGGILEGVCGHPSCVRLVLPVRGRPFGAGVLALQPSIDPAPGTGTGWTFSPCTVEAFIAMLGNVLDTYREHPDSFRALQHRGMERNSSWDKAAAEYEQIFAWAKVRGLVAGAAPSQAGLRAQWHPQWVLWPSTAHSSVCLCARLLQVDEPYCR